MPRIFLACTVLCAMLAAVTPALAISFDQAVKDANPQTRYFFYLHGAIVETGGTNATDKRYGQYKYDSIVQHFENRGLTVIEEVRGRTNPMQYASKISMQVRRLKAKGVPSDHICVAGFSKGGHIALLIASSLNDPELRYVIMAGCGAGRTGKGFQQFLKSKRGARLTGRILSIYAGSDMDAGSCKPAIDQAQGQWVQFKELRLKSPKGHGLFFQPVPEWVNPVAHWARGGR